MKRTFNSLTTSAKNNIVELRSLISKGPSSKSLLVNRWNSIMHKSQVLQMFCKRLLLHLGIWNGEHSSQDLGAKYILIFIFKEQYTMCGNFVLIICLDEEQLILALLTIPPFAKTLIYASLGGLFSNLKVSAMTKIRWPVAECT